MADNTPITAGTGTSIATDDIASVHHQRVKVSLGADGTAVDLNGDSTGGAWVQGALANDAVDTGNPVKVGGRAHAGPTAVSADGDRVNQWFTKLGAAVVAADYDGTAGSDGVGAINSIPGRTNTTAGSGTVPLAIGNYSYNGTTWDRIRGDTTNGLDVDITRLPALVAGSAAIGKLAANSGIDIGDVDVTSIIPGTGATNQGKAVDSAAGATDTGVAVLVVRDDVLGTLTPVDNDYTPLRVDSTGSLWIRTQPIVKVTQSPTVSTSPAYTAKDAVGGLLTFANVARVSGGQVILQSVTVYDLSQQRPSLELVLFDRTFTPSSDNAIFAPSDADLASSLGVVAINSWSDFSTNSIATVDGIGKAMVLFGTSLFGQLVTRGTPTFVATSDIFVSITAIQV